MSDRPRVPWVTLLLVVLCIPAGYAVFWNPGLIERFGFNPHHPLALTAFTGLFLHANALHLLGNLLAVAAVGSWVEQATGWLRFTVIYFLSGLAGVALHWAIMKQAPGAGYLIGASGCAAGLTAFGTVRYMWSRVALGPRIRVPVVAMGGIWLGLQAAGALLVRDAAGGVSYWAHIGGAVAGLLLAAVFGASKDADFHRGRKTMTEMGERSPAAQLAAAQAQLRTHPEDQLAWREAAIAHEALGHPADATDAWIKVWRLSNREGKTEATQGLSRSRGLQELPATERSQVADQIRSDHPLEAEILWRSIAESEDPERPFALLALGTHYDGAAEIAILCQEFPHHDATEIARRRGLIA